MNRNPPCKGGHGFEGVPTKKLVPNVKSHKGTSVENCDMICYSCSICLWLKSLSRGTKLLSSSSTFQESPTKGGSRNRCGKRLLKTWQGPNFRCPIHCSRCKQNSGKKWWTVISSYRSIYIIYIYIFALHTYLYCVSYRRVVIGKGVVEEWATSAQWLTKRIVYKVVQLLFGGLIFWLFFLSYWNLKNWIMVIFCVYKSHYQINLVLYLSFICSFIHAFMNDSYCRCYRK